MIKLTKNRLDAGLRGNSAVIDKERVRAASPLHWRSNRSKILVPALLICLALALPAQVSASVQDDAIAFAVELRGARTIGHVVSILERILDRLGVPVHRLDDYDFGENPGDVTADDMRNWAISSQPGLLDLELEIVAEGYLAGNLTPLDGIVSGWRQAGIVSANTDGAAVESALRQIRQLASSYPDDERGLAILIFDALGQRERRPFSLLGPMDSSCRKDTGKSGTAAGFMGNVMDELTAAIGDDEEGAKMMAPVLAMLGKLSGSGSRSSTGTGNESSSSSPKDWMDSFTIDTDPPSTEAQSQAPSIPTSSAGGMAQSQAAYNRSKQQVQERKREAIAQAEKWTAEVSASHPLQASDLLQAHQFEIHEDIGWGMAEDLWVDSDRGMELLRLENENTPNADGESIRRLMLLGPQPEETLSSCLFLDPVQIMLLTIDMFGLIGTAGSGGEV